MGKFKIFKIQGFYRNYIWSKTEKLKVKVACISFCNKCLRSNLSNDILRTYQNNNKLK